MKANLSKNLCIAVLLIASTSSSIGQINDTIVDDRDGKVYKIVKIGEQWWTAQNAQFETVGGSWAYENDKKIEQQYGRLYSWFDARRACPTGWTLPSDKDWMYLEKHLGMPLNEIGRHSEARGQTTNIGGKLKSRETWDQPNKGGSNQSGFNALGAGQYAFSDGPFVGMGEFSFFWTSSYKEETGFVWARGLHFDKPGVLRWELAAGSQQGFSVRCVKEEEEEEEE